MQISTRNDGSKVSFTYDTNRFIASSDANWDQVVAGNQISIYGSIFWYQVVEAFAPGTPGNTTVDRWELTVIGVIAEATSENAGYAISKDFTSELNMWDPQMGDTQTLQMLKRNFWILDAAIGSFGNSYQEVTIDEAGNTNSEQEKTTHTIIAAIEAGAGVYTATISLLERAEGDICKVRFDLPAGNTNPKVQVFNGSPAGTKLFEWQHDGVVTAIIAEFVRSATAWKPYNAQFIQ